MYGSVERNVSVLCEKRQESLVKATAKKPELWVHTCLVTRHSYFVACTQTQAANLRLNLKHIIINLSH